MFSVTFYSENSILLVILYNNFQSVKIQIPSTTNVVQAVIRLVTNPARNQWLFTTVNSYLLTSGVKKKNVLNDVNARMGTFSTKENVSKKNSVQVKYKYVCLYVCLVSFQY